MRSTFTPSVCRFCNVCRQGAVTSSYSASGGHSSKRHQIGWRQSIILSPRAWDFIIYYSVSVNCQGEIHNLKDGEGTHFQPLMGRGCLPLHGILLLTYYSPKLAYSDYSYFYVFCKLHYKLLCCLSLTYICHNQTSIWLAWHARLCITTWVLTLISNHKLIFAAQVTGKDEI